MADHHQRRKITSYDIQVDNVGPLTTIWTGPTTCLETTTRVGSEAYYVAAFWDDVPDCYPPGTQSYDFHSEPQFYSPGICPSGWAPITSLGLDYPKTASDYSVWALSTETTVWLCCPSGYSVMYAAISASTIWYYTNDCQSTLLRGEHMTSLYISGSPPGSVAVSITASSTVMVLANGIVVMWQSTDKAVVEWWSKAAPATDVPASTTSENLPSSTPDTTSSSSSESPTPSEMLTSSSDSSASSTSSTDSMSASNSDSSARPDPHSNSQPRLFSTIPMTSSPTLPSASTETTIPDTGGLSTGAKAGIGVTIPLVVSALLFGLFFCLKRRNKTYPRKSFKLFRRAAPPQVLPEMATGANTHEMLTKHNIPELPDNIPELPGKRGTTLHRQEDHAMPVKTPLAYQQYHSPQTVSLQYASPYGAAVVSSASPHEAYQPKFPTYPPQEPPSSSAPVRQEIDSPQSHDLYPQGDIPAQKSATPLSSSYHESSSELTDEEEAKLQILGARMERVRENKERLEKIQELKEMEEMLKEEILATQRGSKGG